MGFLITLIGCEWCTFSTRFQQHQLLISWGLWWISRGSTLWEYHTTSQAELQLYSYSVVEITAFLFVFETFTCKNLQIGISASKGDRCSAIEFAYMIYVCCICLFCVGGGWGNVVFLKTGTYFGRQKWFACSGSFHSYHLCEGEIYRSNH